MYDAMYIWDFSMTYFARAFMIVSITLTFVPVRAFGGEEVRSLPTNVFQVFGAKGERAGELVVVFAQFGRQSSGFIAKSYQRDGSTTIADYVVPWEVDEYRWVLGIDSGATHVLLQRTDGLSRPLGLSVYDLAQGKEVSEIPDTNSYIGVTRSMKVVEIDSADGDDSCTISVVDVLERSRHTILRVSKQKVRNEKYRIVVVGNALLVKDGFSYRIYDLEARIVTATGLLSTQYGSVIGADDNVIDHAAGIIAVAFDASTKTVYAFDVRQGKPIEIHLPFEIESDDVRLLYLDVGRGIYIFKNSMTSLASLYRLDQRTPRLQWNTYSFSFRTFYADAPGTEKILVGTQEAVTIVDLSDYTTYDVATVLDPENIQFNEQTKAIILQDGSYNVLYDMERNDLRSLSMGTRVNTSTDVSYWCGYSANGTTVEIDSVGTLSARETRMTMKHTDGCDLLAFTSDKQYAISATTDTVYVYGIHDSAILAQFAYDKKVYDLRDAYAIGNSPLFLLVGTTATIRVELINGTWSIDKVAQVTRTTELSELKVKGRYYRDRAGAQHFLYRPDERSIGDYNLEDGTNRFFTPTSDRIDHVVSDTTGRILVVTSEPRAFWCNANGDVVSGSIEFPPNEQIQSLDYLYSAGMMAYRSINQIRFKQTPVTSVGIEGQEGGARASSASVEVHDHGNSIVITANAGTLESVRICTLVGQEIVHQDGIGNQTMNVDLKSCQEGLFLFATIVGDDNTRSYHRYFILNGCSYRASM